MKIYVATIYRLRAMIEDGNPELLRDFNLKPTDLAKKVGWREVYRLDDMEVFDTAAFTNYQDAYIWEREMYKYYKSIDERERSKVDTSVKFERYKDEDENDCTLTTIYHLTSNIEEVELQ